MIEKIIDIPIYDWDVTFLIVEDKKDIPDLNKWYNLFQARYMGDLNKEFDNIKNAGQTFIDRTAQKILVTIFPCTNFAEKLVTIGHEKRHVEDLILEECGINDKEAAAYLSGYLSQHMFYFIKE
jgi:hypothetical protein